MINRVGSNSASIVYSRFSFSHTLILQFQAVNTNRPITGIAADIHGRGNI